MIYGSSIAHGPSHVTASLQAAYAASCPSEPAIPGPVFQLGKPWSSNSCSETFLIKVTVVAPSTPFATGTNYTIMQPEFFEYDVPIVINDYDCTDFIYNVSVPTAAVNTQLDGLFKSIYSLLLADLGQLVSTNILADPKLIMQMLEMSPARPVSTSPGPPDVFANETKFFDWFGSAETYSDLGRTIYNPLRGLDGQPSTLIPVVFPAVILTQYTCQVPELKSIGSLLIAVVVADLVFVQTLWTVLNFVVTFVLTRRHRDAQYCEGCTKQLDSSQHSYALANSMEKQA